MINVDLSTAANLASALVGIVALLLAILGRWQRRKELSYNCSSIEWASLQALEMGEYKGPPEKTPSVDAHMLFLRLINSGNLPISSKDFEESIIVTFEAPSKIIGMDETVFYPSELRTYIGFRQNTITISPLLLNPGNWILLKLLVDCFDLDHLKVAGHIAGVSDIKRRRFPLPRGMLVGLALWAIASFIAYGLRIFYYFYYGIQDSVSMIFVVPLFGLITVGYVVLIISWQRYFENTSRWATIGSFKVVKTLSRRKSIK